MLQRSYDMTSPPVVRSQGGSMKQDWGQHRVIGSIPIRDTSLME